MFIHSKFVLVDDKEHHLDGLRRALNALRLDCHAKLYSDEAVGDWAKLPGTRVLFLDQNLTTGATFGGTDNKVAFAALQEVIHKLICPSGGPYGLVLWAELPALEAFRAEMLARFTGDDARLIPAFFTTLTKGDYINTTTGADINAAKLRSDIMARISENPQMRALMTWEADCSAAVDAVLRSVVELVPLEKRRSTGFAEELGKVLYRLSQAGAGAERARENPREALNSVMVPILADRILEHDPDSGHAFDWNSALQDPTDSPTVQAQGAINSAIHLSFARSPQSRPIQPIELGAVVKLPADKIADFLNARFGITEDEFRGSLFKVNEAEWADCRPRLVQIGAACDAAQPKPGPLLFLFAVEWSFANADGRKTKGGDPKGNLSADGRKPKDLEWLSPILQFDPTLNPGHLSVFKNLAISVPRAEATAWKSVYRLREELVSQLTQSYARHISRPGILTLPA